jgi:hypothetical protein
MRAAGLLLLVSLTLAVESRAETKFPYPLTVPAGGATLRSGPSFDFYPTDRLAPGTRLEVYREKRGGWLAVRPPPGSFSLVERHQLKASGQSGVAIVQADDVLACIGSRAGAVQAYVSQVRLRKDEPVELLDAWEEEVSESADQGWCRISPPAGEFRWVHADEFQRQAAVPTSEPAGSAGAASTANTGPQTASPRPGAAPRSSFEADGWVRAPSDRKKAAVRPTAEDEALANQANSPDRSATERPTPLPPIRPKATAGTSAAIASAPTISVPTTSVTTPKAPVTEAPPASAPAAAVPAIAIPPDPAPLTSATAPPVSTAEQWSSRTPPPRQSVEELEVDLALMVAGEPQTWRLADLRRRVEVNLIRYETAEERAQARRLLDRIAEFEQLHSRVAQAVTAPQTAQPTPPAAATAPATVSAVSEAAAQDAADVKYDGSGWLVPVHSTTGAAPPFALLDAQGEVLGYVSPTPGLNMQRYLRKQVGLFGLRGYVPTLNKPHVTAERVVELDRHLR